MIPPRLTIDINRSFNCLFSTLVMSAIEIDEQIDALAQIELLAKEKAELLTSRSANLSKGL